MRYTQIIKFSVIGLVTNLTRSLLTTLGIVIGIASVIGLMALGQGAQDQIISQISALGVDVVIVMPSGAQQGPMGDSSVTLEERDYDYLNNKTRFPGISIVSPLVNSNTIIRKGSDEIAGGVSGVSENYATIRNMDIEAGSFLREQDITGTANVAVIGYEVATELFGENELKESVGEYVIIDNMKFKVKGVLAKQETSQINNPNTDVYLPYTTAMSRIIQTKSYNSILYKVEDKELIDITNARVKEKFSEFRGVDNDNPNFQLYTSGDIQETASQITGILTALLSSIAAISLVVGGIGIMNIMLVSVTERTKEIGLRKAVGAKRKEILLQFLLESIILTFMGGIIGITMGILLGKVIGGLVNIESSITLDSILLASGVSIAIGIVFGFYPAYRASKLDPIDALRYE